ncbi:hypothetical protein SAY86_022614 [Trapa natans]|uniref:Uncharacterized protein n=1 Tax=Trapa natans TaxID=22666 RepID=A0AAN7LVX5_TRANT|nr:hypothetical protein SAY86_022614 [Trapa natans]
MAISSPYSSSTWTCLLLLCCISIICLLLGHGRVEASHSVYTDLENSEWLLGSSRDQPYRTAYHFQPPKNWMNGCPSSYPSSARLVLCNISFR